MTVPALGKLGVWSSELRWSQEPGSEQFARDLEGMGYGALWIPGGFDDKVLEDVSRLLAATEKAVIATGILNLWKYEPAAVADWFAGLSDTHKARTMIGIGISHSALIGEDYARPLANTRKFLEGLEAAGMAMDNTSLAALGPKMVALSGDRTAGAHPYLVDAEHTRRAREILGPGKLLAPEQGVAFGADAAQARKTAATGIGFYNTLPNYRNNWLRLGYSDEEIENDADRFIDGIVACGEVATMAGRVREHWQAGADHVCVQIISAEGENDFATLTDRFRRISEALA
ncbi:MAG: TIGR03620 family F420-dependent LLM class oxidoreductase [Novosphingobium sp.]|nr:TIGR03620 family F420-dependent LLM class oxidoreductase [Novosphingobium sp.]